MTEETTLTACERLRIHIREARRTTDSPIVGAQLAAALDAWKELSPTPLQESHLWESRPPGADSAVLVYRV